MLKVHSGNDWLLKLRIAFAIHLRATRAGVAPGNIVTFFFLSVGERGWISSPPQRIIDYYYYR